MLGHQVLLNKYGNHGSRSDFLQKEGHRKRAAEVLQKVCLRSAIFLVSGKNGHVSPRHAVCMVTQMQVF